MVEGFKSALCAGEVLVGSWLQINHPTAAEILANAGYDWVGVDLEHSDIDMVSFTALLRAVHGRGPAVLARVSENDVIEIRRALDVGAHGVIVPLVGSAADAERAVRAAKYPPIGVRGFCFSRMNDWGSRFDDYVSKADHEIAVIVMIESREGVEHIDEILAVEGGDGVFIGPYDMSGSYGVPGRTADLVVLEACAKVVAACRRASKPAGLHLVAANDASIRRMLDGGFTFVCLGGDIIFMNDESRRVLESLRRLTSARTGELRSRF